MSLLSEHTQALQNDAFTTRHQLLIERNTEPLDPERAAEGLAESLDRFQGALFSSSFEYTGRYTRWDVGFINPPIELRLKGRDFTITALNGRGEIILTFLKRHMPGEIPSVSCRESANGLAGTLPEPEPVTEEADRTRQASIFDVLRAFKRLFSAPNDRFLGLYGAFGYDLIFQMEAIEKQITRPDQQSDLILYMPDQLIAVDRKLEAAYQVSYDFAYENQQTRNMFRETMEKPYSSHAINELPAYRKGHFQQLVETAMPAFQEGLLYEVVPSQLIQRKCQDTPSTVFQRLKEINPSPYGFLINLGDEHLAGASPEMFVRVEGNRVETCPISGTIKRSGDAVEDAEQIKKLLNSEKDEIELTMCTDVDRNDKSRICVPGSVKIIGRRQIEAYSHLFHTVDHIEGTLRPEFDALDAFMTHMWAVTVTGSPKPEAARWIEEHESSPRGWYGGAVGFYTFDGSLNTGLTLRTARLKDGVGDVRAGATVLHASDPKAEEEETLVKAQALIKVLENRPDEKMAQNKHAAKQEHHSILLVDHEDSFVHTLADYLRQTGASVTVSRPAIARRRLRAGEAFSLVVLSPGPGRPERFQMAETIQLCLERDFPLFGVCLGFQGLSEFFGGQLGRLKSPVHGEKSRLIVGNAESPLFEDLETHVEVGRYHSLFVNKIPDDFIAEAMAEDGCLMAARHTDLPVAGVQFHPESILSMKKEQGLKIIHNAVRFLTKEKAGCQ